ncbi:alpha-1,3-mannosyl-glycoprotein 2-beta-N-acetylglucosaminyltransferase [Cylas formicarius]|uniref:alpha-1,3-mannosyl-glycoprotein 2-beta-N-acetylglucosaminyltransferase n=1 Tax=Cylas formicarius TaxID=197179 RepID=UPI0029588208|nr:alpha-1,3-mannosyl-glycoprotein 2-beta-N-acetylglucosaminyltransferase [Cylas formicarius]XP_060536704.1 alpha-1,3-mannosyl-glycoprotein 2-beta-N-acetylglucosaminyltransferase [Cylas formicarius]XP_060536705.1 alpha-1,3-mannosyl-glycoprotein 2-beta-N-acetylglucosaminyltransferase [Cylas formicarius]
MRLKRTILILGIILLAWWSIIYVFLINNLTYNRNKDSTGSIDGQLMTLENGLEEQFVMNKALISEAQQFLENKKYMENSKNNFLGLQNIQIPVLVFACNRITVTRCLDKLLQYRTDENRFPIIVSQDCDHEETTDAIKKYSSQITLIQQPDQSDIQVPPKEKKFKGYFKIARHYGWALNQMFFHFNYSSVIIVEDDLEVAPDFFEYFLATYPLLLKDESLWCISAWNDNGKQDLINLDRPDLLYRTDFFPGLGWMLTRKLWLELYTKWPISYWDDWMRDPSQRRDRSCIRPEISRTRTFGKIGVSNGMFFEKHLKYITLNEQNVPFIKLNLSYLLKENYDREFVKNVYKCPLVDYEDLYYNKIAFQGPVRMMYEKMSEYKLITKKFGLMDDFKSGVPRTAYKGIVTFHYRGRTVHLTPYLGWKGYDVSWS